MALFYHATGREEAESILQEGFAGSWGDVGFGVYLYGDLRKAKAYVARGGWDGRYHPDDMRILEVEISLLDPECGVEQVDPHPEWPNPEDYAHVFFHPMEEDDEEARWTPTRKIVVDDGPAPA